MTQRPELRYAKDGDFSTAYEVFGDGPRDLVVNLGQGLPFEAAWEEPTFTELLLRLADFNRVIRFDRARFTHLEQTYRNRAWVLLDGDDMGREIVARLREQYSPLWDEVQFRCLPWQNFEECYPERFAEAASAAVHASARQERRTKKAELLDHVRTWIDSDDDVARKEFETSAAALIEILREIESCLFS